MAISCAISLTAFTVFSLVLDQHISEPMVLGTVLLMGLLFALIPVIGLIFDPAVQYRGVLAIPSLQDASGQPVMSALIFPIRCSRWWCPVCPHW